MTTWFQKKPVAVKAVQWTGENTEEVKQFCPIAWEHEGWGGEPVMTIESDHPVHVGENYWVVKEKYGYIAYPDSQFKALYGELEIIK